MLEATESASAGLSKDETTVPDPLTKSYLTPPSGVLTVLTFTKSLTGGWWPSLVSAIALTPAAASAAVPKTDVTAVIVGPPTIAPISAASPTLAHRPVFSSYTPRAVALFNNSVRPS